MAGRGAAATAGTSETLRGPEQEEYLAKYNALRQELQLLGDKLAELEMEADEHRLVIAALSPLPPTRRCWRKVGGVLVETDVAGALPALQKTLDGIQTTMENLREVWKKKDAELAQIGNL